MAPSVTRRRDAPVHWSLPADFGLETLAATAAEFSARRVRKTRNAIAGVSVDGAAVQRTHAASLQWLLAVAQSTRAAGQSFRLHQPSPVLRDAARRLGLVPHLMISPEEDCI